MVVSSWTITWQCPVSLGRGPVAPGHLLTLGTPVVQGTLSRNPPAGANAMSRDLSSSVELSLRKESFLHLCGLFGTPQVDLFTSPVNAWVPAFLSWNRWSPAGPPDVFKFTCDRRGFFYAFPLPTSVMFVQVPWEGTRSGTVVASPAVVKPISGTLPCSSSLPQKQSWGSVSRTLGEVLAALLLFPLDPFLWFGL